MATIWYTLNEVIPANGSLVVARVNYFEGKSFEAIWYSDTQTFIVEANGLVLPSWMVCKWHYPDGSVPASAVGKRIAYSYAQQHSIDTSSTYFLDRLLPAFITVFDPGYVCTLGTGIFYNLYNDSCCADFLLVFDGYIRGSSTYTLNEYTSASYPIILNYSNASAVVKVMDGSFARSGSNLLFVFSSNNFGYLQGNSFFFNFEYSQGCYLPSFTLPNATSSLAYNNSLQISVLNSVVKPFWYYAGYAGTVTFKRFLGPATLDLSFSTNFAPLDLDIQYNGITQVILPAQFYGSATTSPQSLLFNNNQFASATLGSLLSDIYTRLAAVKAATGIRKNLTINLSGNIGTLPGGTSNADYIAITTLYSGTGFSVTIFIPDACRSYNSKKTERPEYAVRYIIFKRSNFPT